VVFFDIGGTLAEPQWAPDRSHLIGLEVHRGALRTLQTLQLHDIRMGIISNTGTETPTNLLHLLEQSGLLSFFAAPLLIFSSVVGFEKPHLPIYQLAAMRAGLAACPERCLYVGDTESDREGATQAGWRVASSTTEVESILGLDRRDAAGHASRVGEEGPMPTS
jgi:HAD superfamily hydrolase (TIGR01549 family)